MRYRTRLKWKDPACEDDTVVSTVKATGVETRVWDTCNYASGLQGSRLSATLALEFTDKGQDRYDTMTTMRADLAKVMKDHGGAKTFPYSFEFLYWEEVGVIDAELIRNLAICGAVVSVMIGLLIPHPRIAIWVVLSIVLSVIDLVGFMFYWDVTISGISVRSQLLEYQEYILMKSNIVLISLFQSPLFFLFSPFFHPAVSTFFFVDHLHFNFRGVGCRLLGTHRTHVC